MSRTALITGSSRGIGKEIALQLAEAGFDIVLHARKNQKGLQDISDIIVRMNRKVDIVFGDISKQEDIKNMSDQIIEKTGGVDVIILNAGISRDQFLLRLSLDELQQVINTNLISAFALSKLLIKKMMKNKWGRIICLSSVVGLKGNIAQSAYAASKAGLIGFVKSSALELARKNITVNAIAPGFIDTDMTKRLDDSIKEALLDEIPLRREGKPIEVASLVRYLCTEEAGYITAQTISVDGGMNR